MNAANAWIANLATAPVAPVVPARPPVRVTPKRLRNGDWGVRSTEEIHEGDEVTIVAMSGNTWSKIVDRVVWTDGANMWIAETREATEVDLERVKARAEAAFASEPSTEETSPDTVRDPSPVSETNPIAAHVDAFTIRPCGRRPRPYVTRTTAADLASWEPVKRENYYQDGDEMVRSGEQFAIVRPGHSFPLGHASDHRRLLSHNRTRESIMSGPVASGQITPKHCYVAGHGYHVVQTFEIRHLSTATINGVDVTHELVVTNDHTGAGSMRASLVCFVGLDAVGAVATLRARHVAGNPERWQSDVDALIETAVLKQDEIIEILTRAQSHAMTDEDRRHLRKRDVIVKRSARTALDAFRAWHSGNGKARPTWGVWARRLDDKGLKVLRDLLDRQATAKPGIAKPQSPSDAPVSANVA